MTDVKTNNRRVKDVLCIIADEETINPAPPAKDFGKYVLYPLIYGNFPKNL